MGGVVEEVPREGEVLGFESRPERVCDFYVKKCATCLEFEFFFDFSILKTRFCSGIRTGSDADHHCRFDITGSDVTPHHCQSASAGSKTATEGGF